MPACQTVAAISVEPLPDTVTRAVIGAPGAELTPGRIVSPPGKLSPPESRESATATLPSGISRSRTRYSWPGPTRRGVR
ncbi:hypothetical protein A7K94_0202200 [Modestobacter sp. VKM Ac-2676]|nr:hypothetical protein A7K94_0202200 [Modestobacter sp. VKM Ac-2676]